MIAVAADPMATRWDDVRAIAVVIGAVAQVALAFLPDILGLDLTIATRSEGSRNPLIPYGAAFVIWAPLYIGSLWFAFRHARPHNLSAEAFQRVGWWAAAAFFANASYAVFYPAFGSPYGDSLTILPFFLAAAVALLRRPRDRSLPLADRLAFAALSGLAGWISVAAIVTLAMALETVGMIDFERPVSAPLLALLGVGIAVAAALAYWSGSRAFAAAASWGLFWLAVESFLVPRSFAIGVCAAVAAMIVLGVATYSRRSEARRGRVPA